MRSSNATYQGENEMTFAVISQDARHLLVRGIRQPPQTLPLGSLVKIQRIVAHCSPMTVAQASILDDVTLPLRTSG